MADLLRQFGDDPTVIALGGLIALDFVLGVSAALKAGTFRLSYVADLLRNDVLGKAVPYFGLWAVVHLTGDITIGDFGVIEEAAGAAAVLAVSGSVLNSLRDLGLGKSVPDAIAGPDLETEG